MFIQMRKSALLLMIAPALLAGCGGSGSQGTDKAVAQNTYIGQVIDGYLQGAIVFADVNRNGVLDAGEPSDTTRSNGVYSLTIPQDVYNPPIIVDVPATAIDADTGQAVGFAYRMTAPDGLHRYITPITSMVKGVLESYPGMKLADAENVVRGFLHLSDTFELYADYTLTARPASLSLDKWERFIKESGRARNIGRISASALGKYWQQARSAYGGTIAPEKMEPLQNLLAVQVARMVAPITESLPNDGLIDLAAINIGNLGLTREQIEANLRQTNQAAASTLTKAIAQGPLHIVPFRNGQSNYMHFRLSDGGSTSASAQSIVGQSSVIPSDLSETDALSMQSLGSTSLFSGDLRFESGTATEFLSDGGKSMRLRMVQLPVAGELQSGIIDSNWLRNKDLAWPANASAYKMLVRTTTTALLYLNDPSKYLTGTITDALQICCGLTSNGYRIGDLGLKFGAAVSNFTGLVGGEIQLVSYADGTAKALDQKGSWGLEGGFAQPAYIAVVVPSSYQAQLKNAGNDRLFSAFGAEASLAFGQIGTTNKVSLLWKIPSDRYIELVTLNDAAFNALKANLKW